MSQQSASDANRVVISDKRTGPLLPTTQREMARDVYVNAGAKNINGGIYGDRIELNSPCVVDGPVFSTADLVCEIDPTTPGEIRVNGPLEAGLSVTVNGARGVTQGLRVHGGIRARNIVLENAIVRGNIYGRMVRLENCLVFGSVFVEESLRVESSLLGTFQGPIVEVGTDVGSWLPFALAEDNLVLEHPIKCFAFYPPSSWNDSLETKDDLRIGYVLITEADKRMVRIVDDKTGTAQKRWILSLCSRILNMSDTKETIQRTAKELEIIVRGPQLTKDAQAKYASLVREDVEDEIFGIFLEGGLFELDTKSKLDKPVNAVATDQEFGDEFNLRDIDVPIDLTDDEEPKDSAGAVYNADGEADDDLEIELLTEKQVEDDADSGGAGAVLDVDVSCNSADDNGEDVPASSDNVQQRIDMARAAYEKGTITEQQLNDLIARIKNAVGNNDS